jgi:cytochrome c peroxidase
MIRFVHVETLRPIRFAVLRKLATAALIAIVGSPVFAAEPIIAIPLSVDADAKKVALGQMLFYDSRLSKDDTVSCNSCHELAKGGADGRQVSMGVGGAKGRINAPTVFNSAGSIKQFWDGRADDLHSQVDGPVQAAVEMGSLWPDVITKLYADKAYPELFDDIYEDGITRDSIKDALAEFESQLISPNSRFDKWLGGEKSALTEQELRGYGLFKQYGCSSCHQGTNVGGNMFQVFGVLNSYFQERGNITKADLGRFNVTGNEADKHAFKVPSLRLAALTAPYLHDGSAKTLRDAVNKMFRFQLGREAPDNEKEDIVAFIKTLAGELKGFQE